MKDWKIRCSASIFLGEEFEAYFVCMTLGELLNHFQSVSLFFKWNNNSTSSLTIEGNKIKYVNGFYASWHMTFSK